MFMKSIKKTVDKINKKTDVILKQELTRILEREVEEMKEILIESYERLNAFRFHKKSELNTRHIQGHYETFIDDFEYITITDDVITLSLPDVEELFESDIDELDVIGTIVEGLNGVYYEISKEERKQYGLENITGFRFFVKNSAIYLYRSGVISSKAKKDMRAKKTLKRWPFHTSEDIFEEVMNYKNDNISKWKKEAADETAARLKFAAKGV